VAPSVPQPLPVRHWKDCSPPVRPFGLHGTTAARHGGDVAAHVELVSSLVSAEFPVSRASEAFELAASGSAVKVQLVGHA
jgi:hypothetical protein